MSGSYCCLAYLALPHPSPDAPPHPLLLPTSMQEIKLLASMSGLQLDELYGEMDLGVDLSHEEAYRMIAVLKKL